MSYRQLTTSNHFEHRICGLVLNLTNHIQSIHQQQSYTQDFIPIANKIKSRVNGLVSSFEENVVIVGSAMKDYYCSVPAVSENTQVIVYLLMDFTTSIDCKMITLIAKDKNLNMDAIWQALYRYDPTTEIQ
jgi:hypothetical protein